MLLAGVVQRGREKRINDHRTNTFKARLVTAVWRSMKRNDGIHLRSRSPPKDVLVACRGVSEPMKETVEAVTLVPRERVQQWSADEVR